MAIIVEIGSIGGFGKNCAVLSHADEWHDRAYNVRLQKAGIVDRERNASQMWDIGRYTETVGDRLFKRPASVEALRLDIKCGGALALNKNFGHKLTLAIGRLRV